IGMSLILGPQLMRQDFRQDLAVADILKMYPLRGWQVALGELLAPVTILTAIQWCLLVLAAGLPWHLFGDMLVPLSTRLAVGLGAAMVCPMLNLISLLIPNLAVLLFPSWFQGGKESPQGIEATGQRLIAMLAQLLVFLVALVLPFGALGVVLWTSHSLIGWAAAVLPGCAAAAIILAIESAFGLVLLGRLFERLDLSAESTS